MGSEEFSRSTKADPAISSIHLVMMVPVVFSFDEEKKKELKIEAYIGKPMQRSRLFNYIISIMSHSVETPDQRQLLTFSKGGKPVKRKIPLQSVIENSARFALSSSSADYKLKLDTDLWHADLDEGQIGQVIQNIVLNAYQAMPMGGSETIGQLLSVNPGSRLLYRAVTRMMLLCQIIVVMALVHV